MEAILGSSITKAPRIDPSRSAIIIFCAILTLPVFVNAATVSGVVVFEGEPPERTLIKMTEASCKAFHGDAKEYTEDAIVGDAGKVQNVFVYVKAGLTDKSFDVPAEPVTLNQKGCVYSPHVLGIMVGQKLKITNSDPVLHNIHVYAKSSREFNIAQPIPGTRTKSFPGVESAIAVKCDIHPWMGAYIHVLDHPFFAVTNDRGEFALENLPAGRYTIEAWHEKFGLLEANITVRDAVVPDVNFTFKPKASH